MATSCVDKRRKLIILCLGTAFLLLCVRCDIVRVGAAGDNLSGSKTKTITYGTINPNDVPGCGVNKHRESCKKFPASHYDTGCPHAERCRTDGAGKKGIVFGRPFRGIESGFRKGNDDQKDIPTPRLIIIGH